jgi:putative transposase
VARRLNSHDVINVLSDLFILRGVPAQIRSDNGPEFIAKAANTSKVASGARTRNFLEHPIYPRTNASMKPSGS